MTPNVRHLISLTSVHYIWSEFDVKPCVSQNVTLVKSCVSQNVTLCLATLLWLPIIVGDRIDPVTQAVSDESAPTTQALSDESAPTTQSLGNVIDLVTQNSY